MVAIIVKVNFENSRQLIAIKDSFAGDILSLGSGVLDHLPKTVSRRFTPPAPSGLRIRWRNSGLAVAAMPPAHVTIPGIGEAGRTPSDYPEAAVIKIDRKIMDTLLAGDENTKPVFSYALGTVVMYGMHKDESVLGLAAPDARDYEIAMGIGKGPLKAWVEVVTMTKPPHRKYSTEHHPLETGVQLSRILPMATVPSHIPVI